MRRKPCPVSAGSLAALVRERRGSFPEKSPLGSRAQRSLGTWRVAGNGVCARARSPRAAPPPSRSPGGERRRPSAEQPFQETLRSSLSRRGPRLLASLLTWCVDTAEESAQMSGQRDENDSKRFQRQTEGGQIVGIVISLRVSVNQPHQPDQEARADAKHEVQEQCSFESLALKLPLPGE